MICENSYAESDTKNLESFMNIKELNEAIDKALCEDEDKFIPMLMDYFNVSSSDIRKATEDESMASDITYDNYYVKDKGFFEVASKEDLINICCIRLEELEDAAEPSVVAKIFQNFIDKYGEEILLNKEITKVTEDNLEDVVNNFDFKKLSEFLLSDDIDYVTEIGNWVNSYDGKVHFLGNSNGTDYYISRFNESVKQTKSSNKSVNESYVVKEKDDCPIYNTVGCEECDMAAEGLCLIGTDIREFKQDNQNESVIDKKSMKEDEGFKVGDFVFSRANFRYGYIKDFDGRLYTVEFVCSVEGSEEMAKTDSVAPAYLEDGNIRLDLKIADLERQLAAQKEIKEKFANKVTNEAVDAGKKSVKEEMEYNKKKYGIYLKKTLLNT